MKKILVLVTAVALVMALGVSALKAEEPSVTLTVIVTALGNSPVENASVTVGDREDTTKKNGACTFTLPPGDYTICAKGEWGGMSAEKCQDVTLRGTNRFVIIELFQKVETVW